VTESPPTLPDAAALTSGLSAAFGGPVVVFTRERNVMASTFPSEVVTCRLADGSDRRVFCKYGARHIRHRHGHRGGVTYEAWVYRDLLHPARVPVPAYYGSHTDPATGDVWLFLEYLADGVRVNKSPHPAAMTLAAGWLGRFHRVFEGRAVPGLNVYDADYYGGWARRTAEFAGAWRGRFPWIDALCERFAREVTAELCQLPVTVIHGELYPCNVLLTDGVVRTIDWESAAVAPGEVDLASLTECWPAQVAEECEQAYRASRWPDGAAPTDLDRRLAMARLYWGFRWLGWLPERTAGEKSGWYFQQLHAAGERLGLLSLR
jgi:hypothetical protein